MTHNSRHAAIATALLALLASSSFSAKPKGDTNLLKTREAVWRAWFSDDVQALKELVPEDTLVISAGERDWKKQPQILQTAAEFHAAGGKLIRLAFPRTEIQHFGHVAIIWSEYIVETETNGKRSLDSGRASEVFVWRHGRWTNPGWHTDSAK